MRFVGDVDESGTRPTLEGSFKLLDDGMGSFANGASSPGNRHPIHFSCHPAALSLVHRETEQKVLASLSRAYLSTSVVDNGTLSHAHHID